MPAKRSVNAEAGTCCNAGIAALVGKRTDAKEFVNIHCKGDCKV
jgi:hypothetical protein